MNPPVYHAVIIDMKSVLFQLKESQKWIHMGPRFAFSFLLPLSTSNLLTLFLFLDEIEEPFRFGVKGLNVLISGSKGTRDISPRHNSTRRWTNKTVCLEIFSALTLDSALVWDMTTWTLRQVYVYVSRTIRGTLWFLSPKAFIIEMLLTLGSYAV